MHSTDATKTSHLSLFHFGGNGKVVNGGEMTPFFCPIQLY